MSLPLKVPIDIGRFPAADAARRELAKTVYAQGRPSVEQHIVDWILARVLSAIESLAAVGVGELAGLIVVAGAIATVVIVIVRGTGPMHRSASEAVPLFLGLLRSAAEYRAAADTAARSGNWDEAVRQRFRAVVRSLEERDILDPRPGRTAGEAASDAARALPSCAVGLRAAAHSFDDVAYGGRPGDQQADASLRDLDRQLATTRPGHQPAGVAAPPVPVR